MQDVFEPTANFGGEVFEPMNFGGRKSKGERLKDAKAKLNSIINSNKLSNSQKEKIALAVATGGVFAGLYLVSRFLTLSKKSRFEGDDNFAGEVFEPMNFDGEVFEPMNFDGEVFEPMNFDGNEKVKGKLFKKKAIKKQIKPITATKPVPPTAPVTETKPVTETTMSTETPADEKLEADKKIFGMPKKVVLGVGITLVVVGIASFFYFKKKK